MHIKPTHTELVEIIDAGQGPIAVVKVTMPDGKFFQIICTQEEYESLLADGIEVD